MFDIDEIRKQALASMRETMEKNEERISKIEVPSSEKGASVSAAEVEEQIAANTQRQVEILGQMFGPDSMAQMAVNEELLQKMVNDKVAEATSATAGDLMGQLFGEDMGILAAALETLEMEDADDEEEFFEFSLHVEPLTEEVALIITDFVDADEEGDAIELWNKQVEMLHRTVGG